MRRFVLFLAAAGAALAVAAPAAAQYYPAPQPYNYGNAYNGYGYNGYNGYNGYGYNGYGEVRELQARIDAIESQIRMLDRRDVIRDGSADRLKDEADRVEHRLHRAARNGLNPYEANEVRARIANLEQRVRYAVANRYDRYGRGDRDDRWGHDRD
jgi:hypothetical protein